MKDCQEGRLPDFIVPGVLFKSAYRMPFNDRSRPATPFLGMAALSVLAVVVSTEVHEFLHFVVGRLAGLPAHFLALTSVGVEPSVVAHAPPYRLALMNGVAPLATMLLGILALIAVPKMRSTFPRGVTDFVAWCAIFAVPYIGIQTMLTAAPIDVRGTGADFAAVIGGYFGLPRGPRVAISLAGLVIYVASGLWLCFAVSPRTVNIPVRLSVTARLRRLSALRPFAAAILGLLLIVMTARSAVLLARGDYRGLAWLFREIYIWGLMMTLIVRWRAPCARVIRDHWIFPGLLGSAGLMAIGLLPQLDDFFFLGSILVLPLIASAWRESASDEKALKENLAVAGASETSSDDAQAQ